MESTQKEKQTVTKQLSGGINTRFLVVFAALLTFGWTITPARLKAQSGAPGAFVYTIANPTGPNLVDAYRQDPTSGKLTFLASYSTGGLGLSTAAVVGAEQHALIADGQLLYAVNPGSNDISVFQISADGSLHLLHSPFPSGGITPVSLALHDHHLLYVANLGDSTTPANFAGFTVHHGFLQPLAGSTMSLNIGDAPADVLFNKKGTVLATSRTGANSVDVFRVGDDGRLSHAGGLGNQLGAFGLAFNPAAENQLFGALSSLPGDASYLIAPDGSASIISTVADPPSINSCWEVISNDGKRAWFTAPLSNSVTLFSIAPNGALTRVGAHTTLGHFPVEAVLIPSNQFMYVLEIDGTIEGLRLNGDSIESIETVSVPGTSPVPFGTVVLPGSEVGIAFVDFADGEGQ